MDGTGGVLNTFRYRREDGREFVGEKRVQHLIDDQGSRVGPIGLIRDVTSHRRRDVQKEPATRNPLGTKGDSSHNS